MESTVFTDGVAGNGTYWRWYRAPLAGTTATSAPPFVMVMGYGGNFATFTESFVQRLAAETPGGVLVFDHLGSGRSGPLSETEELSLADFAGHLSSLLDELGIDTVNIYGYSMGGAITLEFLRANPSRVNKLILCATTAGGCLFHNASPEIVERMRNPRGITFDEMYFDFLSFSMSAEAIKENYATLASICDATRDPMTPRYVLDMKLRAFSKFDASELLQSIACPTLVIHGISDQLIPLTNGIALADNIPHASRFLIENCGHYPHIEKQAEVLKVTLSFLFGAEHPDSINNPGTSD